MYFLNFIRSKKIWIICILSFLSAFIYNEVNLNHLPKDKIRDSQTVVTNDDYSYLYPPENYIKYGVWKEGSNRDQSHYFRPPGYGIIYYVILKTIGAKHSLLFLKFLQLFLFSCSVYWFYFIALSLLKSKKLALISSCIYGITPIAIGFLYFTLTEGVTPSFLLLYVFLLFKGFRHKSNKSKNGYYLSAAFVFSFLFITRPALGVFSLLLPLFLIKDYWKTSVKTALIKLLLFGSIAFSLMAIWQIRNYNIANEYVGLNPIYDSQQVSMYRPPFAAYWEFTGSWAEKGFITLSVMDPFWSAAIKGDTSMIYINNIIKTYPNYVIKHFGKDRLVKTLKKYQEAILIQQPFLIKETLMPKELPPLEKEVVKEIKELTKEFKSNFWMRYHVISPAKVFVTMTFHSNLSLHIFQKTYRGNWLMETIRLIFYVLHSFCFIALILSLFFVKKLDILNYGIVISLFIYIFYLCYFQRGLEERYTLPILPLLLIGLFVLIKESLSLLRRQP